MSWNHPPKLSILVVTGVKIINNTANVFEKIFYLFFYMSHGNPDQWTVIWEYVLFNFFEKYKNTKLEIEIENPLERKCIYQLCDYYDFKFDKGKPLTSKILNYPCSGASFSGHYSGVDYCNTVSGRCCDCDDVVSVEFIKRIIKIERSENLKKNNIIPSKFTKQFFGKEYYGKNYNPLESLPKDVTGHKKHLKKVIKNKDIDFSSVFPF
jgi:hypothetical protein